MKPLSIWYHCIVQGGERDVNPDYSLNLIASQMSALTQSGLADAASSIHIGVNGTEADALAVATMAPEKAHIFHHGAQSRSEIPTMNVLRDWARSHDGWYVLYHHTKGVSTPNQADGWRRRMEQYMVWAWPACVQALDMGYEACGCHWLTPEGNPGAISSPFFGGTFWWAHAGYLNRLPPLPEATWQNRYEAEAWIGRGNPRPKVRDFYPGWPTP